MGRPRGRTQGGVEHCIAARSQGLQSEPDCRLHRLRTAASQCCCIQLEASEPMLFGPQDLPCGYCRAASADDQDLIRFRSSYRWRPSSDHTCAAPMRNEARGDTGAANRKERLRCLGESPNKFACLLQHGGIDAVEKESRQRHPPCC